MALLLWRGSERPFCSRLLLPRLEGACDLPSCLHAASAAGSRTSPVASPVAFRHPTGIPERARSEPRSRLAISLLPEVARRSCMAGVVKR